MRKYLSKYMNSLPEKFNDEFIMGREDSKIIDYVRDIFMSLELLPEIHVIPEEITLETDECQFGPIRNDRRYYKSIVPSRLNRIHYKVHIDGLSYPIERDLYLNKMIDGGFYINEGIRYFLTYQVVDSNSYGFDDGVSLKSLNMPITLLVRQRYDIEAELGGPLLKNLPVYKLQTFDKPVPPIVYILCRYALESLQNAGMEKITNLDNFVNYQDEGIINYLSEFFGFEIKFSDSLNELIEENKTIFSNKNSKEQGVYFSVPTEVVNTNEGKAFIASMAFITNEATKDSKKTIIYTYKDLTNMWFWVNEVGKVFNKSNDVYKKYEKVKSVFISLKSLIDDPSRKTLTIKKKYKENIFTILYYLMINFDELRSQNGQDLTNKRVRLYEYVLYPLRSYFRTKMTSILNQPTRTPQDLEKIFTGLSPMQIIQSILTSELLHYYNCTNEFNLYGALLRYTLHGPAGYSKNVSVEQRSIHPSYTGRISLVASSPGSPGTSGTLVPFLKLYNGYFTKPEE